MSLEAAYKYTFDKMPRYVKEFYGEDEEMFKEIEEKVKEISELDYVSDAYLDKDCLSEGYFSIQIELKESEDD